MRLQFVLAISLIFMLGAVSPGYARNATRSGTYTNRQGSGTFKQNISRQKGKTSRQTQWTNSDGKTGSRDVQAEASNGKGHYSATTNTPNGGSLSTNKDVVKNDDGSYTVKSSYQTGSGKTLSTESTITKTADGITSTGSYQTGDGKSGTYNTSAGVKDGQLERNQSVTSAQGKTISHQSVSSVSDGTLTRRDTVTGPDGKTYGATSTANAKIQDGALVTDVQTVTDTGATFGHHVVTNVEPGTISQQVTNTGANGSSNTFTRSITVDSSAQTATP